VGWLSATRQLKRLPVKVPSPDYTLIDNSYNTQGANIAAQLGGAVATAQIAGTSAVPEPATFGIIGIGVVGLLGRRNKRRVR
jgi:hypothetical protein